MFTTVMGTVANKSYHTRERRFDSLYQKLQAAVAQDKAREILSEKGVGVKKTVRLRKGENT